jgi:hypothetical protein
MSKSEARKLEINQKSTEKLNKKIAQNPPNGGFFFGIGAVQKHLTAA